MTIFNLSRYVAAGLLLLAMASLPYGYYSFLRVVISFIAGLHVYDAYQKRCQSLFWGFAILVVLYNPIMPIHLKKDIWIVINLVSAIFFVCSALWKKGDDKESEA